MSEDDRRVGPCDKYCAVVDECEARGDVIRALRAENAKLLEALNGLMADYYVARRMDGFTDLDVRGLEAYKKARAAMGESDE